MNLYISPSGIAHVTLEQGGKRYKFWSLFKKLEELSKQVPPEVAKLPTIIEVKDDKEVVVTTIHITPHDVGKSLAKELAADWHADEQKNISVNAGVVERTLPTPVLPTQPDITCEVAP